MKSILITLLIASCLTLRFDLPKPQGPVADDGLLLKDIRSIASSIEEGQWMAAIPTSLSLITKVRSLVASKQSPLPALFGFAAKRHPCPYKRCIKWHLRKAHKVAKIFLCRLFKGETEKAQKILKCLNAILHKATLCKKK